MLINIIIFNNEVDIDVFASEKFDAIFITFEAKSNENFVIFETKLNEKLINVAFNIDFVVMTKFVITINVRRF